MRWLKPLLLLLWLASSLVPLRGAEFKTVAGEVYKGELSAADKDGLVVRLESGDFSPRIDWAKLTDETLKDLAENAKAKRFVEPFLDPPAETIAVKEAKEIPVRQPDRLVLPDGKKGIVAALTTPNGLILLGILFFANLFGAYEVARFKWRPVALVCGVSALLPVVGPIIFLLLPKVIPVETENATQVAVQETKVGVPTSGPAPAGAPSGGAAAALGLAKTTSGGSAQEGLPKIFKRGETTFNRRFFETQFPSFFRVVVSEADKELVLDISAGKQSVVATRISRISMTEIHVKTATNAEAAINFAEISEVKLRNKDA
jgi:hypothetical protein